MSEQGRVRLEQVLDLEQIDRDIFRGVSPDTHLQRNFGGQVAAQALVAATRTVAAGTSVHSLHAYFLRPGTPRVPTVYTVDRVRDGRSFATRRVVAVQDGAPVFSLACSFQKDGQVGPEHAEPAPVVTAPEGLEDAAETDAEFQRWHRSEWPEWDLRRVRVPSVTEVGGAPVQQVWIRHRDRLPDDAVFHACALTYASDMTLLGCSVGPHVGGSENLQVASLDHAVWFLRPFRADEWLLYDQTSPSAGGARGLNIGRIFDTEGTLVATVVQEGLVRYQAK